MSKLRLARAITAMVAIVWSCNAWAADQGGTTNPPAGQVSDPCKVHSTEADCTADKACIWSTKKKAHCKTPQKK